MNYADFKLSASQIKAIRQSIQRSRIAGYIKKHGTEPTQEIINGFEATEDDIERHRKYHYADLIARNIPYSSATDGSSSSAKTYDEYIRLTYNVTDIYGDTALFYNEDSLSGIGYMEIDGIPATPTAFHHFSTLGVHLVDVLMKDPSTTAPLKFSGVPALREIVIPACVNRISMNGMFKDCQGIEKITCLAITPPQTKCNYNKYNSANEESLMDFSGINKNGVLCVPSDSIKPGGTATNNYNYTYSEWFGQTSPNSNLVFTTLYHANWTIEGI